MNRSGRLCSAVATPSAPLPPSNGHDGHLETSGGTFAVSSSRLRRPLPLSLFLAHCTSPIEQTGPRRLPWLSSGHRGPPPAFGGLSLSFSLALSLPLFLSFSFSAPVCAVFSAGTIPVLRQSGSACLESPGSRWF